MRLVFGMEWADGYSDLKIEMEFVRAGGHISGKSGKRYGEGLFHHFRRAQMLLWPDDDHHRWSDLILGEYLKNRITIVQGPKDTGKTHVWSRIALTDYWCFPSETLWLVSSTDSRGLELRVWGDIKDLFNRARERYPALAGHVLESKKGIFTDDISEEDQARDIRKGMICIPCIGGNGEWVGIEKFCFATGTMVDTPSGKIAIEKISGGDVVYGAFGPARVTNTVSHFSPKLVRLMMQDGRTIDCTPEHRFLTELGWINAIDIPPNTKLLSRHDSLRDVRQALAFGEISHSVLFRGMQAKILGQGLQGMRQGVCSIRTESDVLLQVMQCHLEIPAAGDSSEDDCSQRYRGSWESDQSKTLGQHETHGIPSAPNEERPREGYASQPKTRNTFQRSVRDSEGGSGSDGHIPGSATQLDDTHRKKFKTGTYGSTLSNGFGVARNQIGCGSGRFLPSKAEAKGERFSKRCVHGESRVERVEILEPSGDPRYDKGSGGYRVHNLEIEGHPSYSVNGCIVHNCGIKQKRRRLLADELQFMKAPYLISLEHLDKGDFKMGGSGNPIGQRDPLDILAEPEAGWGSEVDSGKTDVWKNKFGGVTVQLDGRDTLNNDEPKNKFTYILNQSDIDRTTKRYGTDSSTYWNQIIGRRKSGLDAHRVLTREMCIRYEVFRNVVWEGEDRTSIFSMDAAFGGDRAVGGRIEFGKEVGGQNVILVHPPSIFPVKISKLETAEEQLASQSKKYTDLFGIPDRNVFFDAGMYATLATNMAKTVGVNVNAVNFQGKATTRPVSNDEFVFEEISGGKRLKRCEEAYSKFVTELWWSVRLVAESHQLAGLPEEVAEEFAMREWYKVNGDRFELETKEETKARMGCSPDLADWLAIAVEGARWLGFIIERIRTEETEKEEDDWLERELEKHKRSFAASELKAL